MVYQEGLHVGQGKNKNKLPNELIRKIIQYSSNPGDIVADFFLGNFTTAVVAREMGRIPQGFEKNPNGFKHFIDSVQQIEPGSYLKNLREIPKDRRFNKGKKFSAEEKDRVFEYFNTLRKHGITKRDSIEEIIKVYGRGRWSVERLLKEKQ